MSQSDHDRQLLVREVCEDEAAALALSLARFVAAGYMTGDVACWDAAHNVAESALGAAEGQRLVAAMTGLVRAIRAERVTDWSFMPASCCRVTPAEAQLAGLIALARAGEDGRAAEMARAIAGGPAPRLCAAAAIAADLIAAQGPHGAASAPRPRPAPRPERLH